MKDKEQIIVGGVDVSGCGHLYIRPEDRVVWCTDYLYGNCGAHPYCTFKQLARKTQECNHYRKALEEIEGIAKNFGSYAAWQEQRINKILDIISKAKGEE